MHSDATFVWFIGWLYWMFAVDLALYSVFALVCNTLLIVVRIAADKKFKVLEASGSSLTTVAKKIILRNDLRHVRAPLNMVTHMAPYTD